MNTAHNALLLAFALPMALGPTAGCVERPAPRPPTVIVAVPGSPAAAAPAPAAPAAPSDGPPTEMEKELSAWSPKTRCKDFDYFPTGGIQNFWCHRPARLTVAGVRALAGVDIFTSGPHTDDALVLDASHDFGHYAPGFVRWLVDHAGPSPRGSAAQRATQAMYDRALRPLARVFYLTHVKATRDAACFAKEKSAYEDLIAKKTLPASYYERWFWFMNPQFCPRTMRGAKGDRYYYDHDFDGGVNGNVTKSVVGFWLRRAIDGTMSTFAEGLSKLVVAYDPEIVETVAGLPQSPAAWGVLGDGRKGIAR